MALARTINTDIAMRNDRLRTSIPRISKPDLCVITKGIADMSVDDQVEIMTIVKEYTAFNDDNDPWGEHDFGCFYYNGIKMFWKIDNYAGDQGLRLVLTILLAEEY